MFDFKTNPFNIPPVEKRCQSLTENKDREDILFLAKLAEQAERYDEMKEFMKIVTQMNMGSEPPLEERELFSMAYKRCIMKMRCNFKLMKEAEAKLTTISVDTLNEKQDSSLKLKDLATYRLTAEHEIRKTAHELLNLRVGFEGF